MDTVFVIDDVERSNLMRLFFQSFGCTYICIWSRLPNPSSKCLVFKDGLLMEENNNNNDQPSSSSGSLARRLFAEYKQSTFNVENDVISCVPGFAFKNNKPYLELRELDLQGFASTEVQRQFYTEAKIKRAIFMGFINGEIELGFATVTQLNVEMELRSWFSESFLQQVQLKENEPYSLMGYQDQQAGSSSSSSLRSLSIGSPETTALLSNFSTAPSYFNVTQPFRPTTVPLSLRPAPTMIIPVNQRAEMPPFSILHSPNLPSFENENAAMTNAILTVLSVSPTSVHASNIPVGDDGSTASRNDSARSAFRRYRNYLPPGSTNQIQQNPNRVSTYKMIISSIFKSLDLKRFQELHTQSGGGGGSRGSGGRRPTSSQLHHMISERRRRVKINDSFDALRALLPPGTKKHKARVLNGAIDYLTSLQTQVSELTLQNRRLEAQILPRTERGLDKEASGSSSNSTEGTEVIRVKNVSEATSNDDDRLVDVRVVAKRGEVSLLSLITRIVEFFRSVNNGLSLISMEAETLLAANLLTPTSHISFRLRIEGRDWDESAFQEALRRVIADVVPPSHR